METTQELDLSNTNSDTINREPSNVEADKSSKEPSNKEPNKSCYVTVRTCKVNLYYAIYCCVNANQ